MRLFDTQIVTEMPEERSEFILGLVAPAGVNLDKIQDLLRDYFAQFKYEVQLYHLSSFMNNVPLETLIDETTAYKKISSFMSAGDEIRKREGNDFVAKLGVYEIYRSHIDGQPKFATAHIIRSLKHPDEVRLFRNVYGDGFFLLGFSSSRDSRMKYLVEQKGMLKEEAEDLLARDEHEGMEFGQDTRNVYYLADGFIDADTDDVAKQIGRMLDLIFAHPYITPSKDEYAMYLAFASSFRSGNLSRQVGAVVTSKSGEIIATGVNDVPKSGGGLYWGGDDPCHRDIEKGEDANETYLNRIAIRIIRTMQGDMVKDRADEALLRDYKSKLEEVGLFDITEYGRSVHAEMEALLSCARTGVSPVGGTLYCTTFPCHNCAKHIVDAGISRVVYVEPYVKSKAADLHSDSIVLAHANIQDKSRVTFQSFVGVGPRKFLDLFSMTLGSGTIVKRKANGHKLDWKRQDASLRVPLLPFSYIDREINAVRLLADYVKQAGEVERK